ncbi:MAG: penicillin-binding protein [Anaerolineae bacterium]|nr:penicillin-binding protein [Anaerolineae bacterium]
MSDRPNDRKPDEPEESTSWGTTGGWHSPQETAEQESAAAQEAAVPGERYAWRSPEEQAQPVETWRVPTLPRDLAERQGGWHLPKSSDTLYMPEDESVITSEVAAAPVEGEAQKTHETTENAAPTDAETVGQEALPFDDTGAEEAEGADEDEDDNFSMSELVALASLVDHAPSVDVQLAAPTSAVAEAAPADDSVSGDSVAGTSAESEPLNAAEYARRELARLQADAPTQTEIPTDLQADAQQPEQPGIVSPEEYARQQLARLGAEAPEPAASAAPASPSAPAAQPSLAEKFQQAEASIRALRQQFQAGQITRDQFQADLRRLMVLDDNNVWWMMGVESDRWYRHDNGKWVPATPPVQSAGAAVGTDTGNEGDRTVPTSPITQGWVPARVPVSDPDFTVPGRGGIYLDSDLTADTVPMATVPSGSAGDVTVPNLAVQGQYESVSAPMSSAAESAPAYDVEQPTPTYADAVARQRQQTIRMIGIIAAIIAALIFLVGAVGAIGIVLYYNSLASPYREAIANLANYQPQFRTARILAADGSLIAELTSPQGGARDEININEVAPELVHAVVSIENERYFEDPGWDPVAITRAFLQNISAGEIESGASTITQQVARYFVLQDTTVSAERKLQEIVVAAEIARQYDKNFILQLYLNEIFFGNQSYGIEAASRFYFGHGASDLNLAEAAMLAGVIQAPARYDPVINRQAAFDRMNVVLNQMAQVGCLQFSFAPYNTSPGFCVTASDINSPRVVLQKAQVETRSYQPRTFTVKYPHFVNFVQQQIENNFGTSEMFRRGFEIQTTLLPRVQEVAQGALEQQVNALVNNGVNTGAVMVTDPRDGAIRAMVGSPDFSDNSIDGQVNNAFTWQQPGSSVKIVEYIGALEGVNRNGVNDYYTPASVLWDVDTTFQNPDYRPVNYDRTYHGPVALRYAFANSYNVPAVKTLNFIGVDKFLDVAQRIGLRFLPEATFGLPSALGANEVRLYDMMQAYGTIANDGTRVPLYSITQIKDANGADVTLPERPQPALAVQPQIAFLVQNILSDNEARTAAFGANSPLNVSGYGSLVAAKTGTSNDNRDLWTMGFTSNAVVGVWIGRVDNAPTANTSGLAAAPIWNAVMTSALQGTNPEPFNPPAGIVQQQVCADTGTLYDSAVPCTVVRGEYFVQSQPPPSGSQGFVQTLAVDTWTGLRANQFCPDSVANQTFVNITDPSALAWLQTAPGLAYAASIGLPNPPKPVPTGECSPSTVLPQVHFNSPTNGQQLTGLVQFTGIVSGPEFDHYQIELAPSTNPDSFQMIAGPFLTQANGNLATWDSSSVPHGAYRLRLAAFATQDRYRFYTIDVGVNNILPTSPPPTLTVPTFAPGDTPIPFFAPTPTIFLGG